MRVLPVLLFISVSCALFLSSPAFGKDVDQVIASFEDEPTREGLLRLGDYLRNRAKLRKSNSIANDEFHKIRNAILAYPDFEDQLKEEILLRQKEVAEVPLGTGSRIRYDRVRGHCFRMLYLMQTPESLEVLGGFLDDDADAPSAELLERYTYEELPQANSVGAARAICSIGLREPPATERALRFGENNSLEKTRIWWDKVKSGELSFSFEGQDVEYRFLPDGSWETAKLVNADMGSKSKGVILDSSVPAEVDSSAELESVSENRWIWWTLGLAALAAGGVWAGVRRAA
jgi:hypothetical protein